jgi:hypothetical protein
MSVTARFLAFLFACHMQSEFSAVLEGRVAQF